MDKKYLRRSLKRLTLQLPFDEKKRQSEVVVASLRRHINQLKPSVVALFMPLADEVCITPLVEELSAESGCRVVLPRVESVVGEGGEPAPLMEFYDYRPSEIAFGAFGINEPLGGEPCAVADIDVMILPGVAFTRDGKRLGRGKGFYDAYLSRDGFRAFTIGACYAHQVVDSLPQEPHDKMVDVVVVG